MAGRSRAGRSQPARLRPSDAAHFHRTGAGTGGRPGDAGSQRRPGRRCATPGGSVRRRHRHHAGPAPARPRRGGWRPAGRRGRGGLRRPRWGRLRTPGRHAGRVRGRAGGGRDPIHRRRRSPGSGWCGRVVAFASGGPAPRWSWAGSTTSPESAGRPRSTRSPFPAARRRFTFLPSILLNPNPQAHVHHHRSARPRDHRQPRQPHR